MISVNPYGPHMALVWPPYCPLIWPHNTLSSAFYGHPIAPYIDGPPIAPSCGPPQVSADPHGPPPLAPRKLPACRLLQPKVRKQLHWGTSFRFETLDPFLENSQYQCLSKTYLWTIDCMNNTVDVIIISVFPDIIVIVTFNLIHPSKYSLTS